MGDTGYGTVLFRRGVDCNPYLGGTAMNTASFRWTAIVLAALILSAGCGDPNPKADSISPSVPDRPELGKGWIVLKFFNL